MKVEKDYEIQYENKSEKISENSVSNGIAGNDIFGVCRLFMNLLIFVQNVL